MDIPAVRFAEGSDDIVEGLAIPFGGPFRGNADLYKTRFDKADLCLDWFPERPTLYSHGQDAEVRASVIGTVRTADITDFDDGTRKGKWVKAQLDKNHEYFKEISALVRDGALGWSHGTLNYLIEAEPPTRDGTRNITRWPVVEFTLTPVPANPDAAAFVAMRSVDEAVLRILGTTADEIAVRGWLPEGTTQGDLDDGDFAWVADDASLPDSTRRKLPYKIHGKVNEAGWKAAWSRAHQDGTDFTGGPSQADVIKKLLADAPEGVDTKYDDGKETPPGGRSAELGRRDWSEAADDAAMGAGALGSILWLISQEASEADQVAMLQKAADALSEWIAAERAEVGGPGDVTPSGLGTAYLSAPLRAGSRNSASDQSHIDGAHVAAHAALTHTMAAGANCDTCASPGQEGDDAGGTDGGTTSEDDDDAAARSAGAGPGLIRIVDRPATADVDAAVRAALEQAEEIGRSTAARVLGRRT